jgi:hypothetical protein
VPMPVLRVGRAAQRGDSVAAAYQLPGDPRSQEAAATSDQDSHDG